jgi:4-amino-4-deoxy-L-arabinose transferase-like glycosyltransferase
MMASAVENPVAVEARIEQRRWWWTRPLVLAVLIYLVLAVWLARTKAPWCDEGWFANPAYNLAFRGNMGMSVLEPSGFHLNAYFRGIQEHTYLFPPNHMVALAGWFRLFGASVFSMRSYSICWGALSLVVLFYLFSRFFPDRRVAVLATLFTSVDFVFLWSTADGRTEASANALALCAVASYVYFRERNYRSAVIYSQILGAAAAFIHPNAVVVIIGLCAVVWRFDRRRLSWQHLFLAAAPYLFFASLWAWYIMQSPGDFLAQFLVHAAGHHSERLRTLFRPDIAIGMEIVRHLTAYYLGGLWAGVMKGWMIFIPFLYIPAVVWFLRRSWRQEGPIRMFVTYAVALMLAMTFLNGFKGYFYLIYLVPVYNAMFAVCLLHLWELNKGARWMAAGAGLAFVALQLSISILHIRADEYHRDYLPAIQDLARYRAEGKSIVGTAALGFGMGFSGFKDDVRLGTYSGLNPDVLVLDRSYRFFAKILGQDEPPVYAHILTLLSERYRLVARHGSFWVFERAPQRADGKATIWMDPRQLAEIIETRHD